MTLLIIGLIVVDLFAVITNYLNHKSMMNYMKELDANRGLAEMRAYNKAVGKLIDIFSRPKKEIEP